MANYQLVDHLGRPIQKDLLTQPLAQATVTGVRQPVGAHITRGLDPYRLGQIMREAEDGDPEAYLSMAEEIEEKDLHYLSVLGTRKRQVSQLDITVVASDNADSAEKDLTALVQEQLIDSGVVENYLFDALDAVGKGFSVGEIMWKTTAKLWSIDDITWVDPRFIRFDRATRRTPLLLDTNGQETPLAPFKFMYLPMKAKSGLPMRGGLARGVAWAFLFKNFSLKDWLQFIEVFGQPYELGKFAPTATQSDKEALLSALRSLGVDAAAIIPDNMQVEFPKTEGSTGNNMLYQGMADYMDRQMSKAVLGQTATTDAIAGGHAVGQEHNDVRGDIERADAKALMVAINRQIVRPFIDLNKGPQQRYPWLRIGRADTKDSAAMVDAAEKLVPLGLKVKSSDIREAIGFTEPQDGDEVLTPATPSFPGLPGLSLPANDPNAQKRALAARQRIALLAAELRKDAITEATREQLAGWERLSKPVADQIVELAARSQSFDDFRAALAKLDPNMDELGEHLALLTFQSVAHGILGDTL